MIKLSNIEVKTHDDLSSIYDTIRLLDINDLIPHYLGFKGTIVKAEKNSYISKGVYKWIDEESVEITELPIGIWTEDYKDFLENMITNGLNNLKYIENHYTSMNVKFVLHFNTSVRNTMGDKFETLFKMQSSKNLSINNIHLFNKTGAIEKYENTTDIIKEWSETRILKYYERKMFQIKTLEKEAKILSNKIRFILDIISGTILIMNKKLSDITIRLIELKYPPVDTNDGDIDDENVDVKNTQYNYLLKMPISQLTYDRKIILEKEFEVIDNKIKTLKDTNIETLWLEDLNELEKGWILHRDNTLKDYDNDLKGIVEPKNLKKKNKK